MTHEDAVALIAVLKGIDYWMGWTLACIWFHAVVTMFK